MRSGGTNRSVRRPARRPGSTISLPLPAERVAVRLMNTIWADRLGVHDAISTTADLGTWLNAVFPLDAAQASRPGPQPGPADLSRFRALRDGLRRLAALLVGDTRPTAEPAPADVQPAVAVVNEAAALAPLWPRLTYQNGHLLRVVDDLTDPQQRLTSIAQQAVDLLTGND